MKVFSFTVLALIAFAANSVLCRMALGTGQIDAASFTSVRLVSGAVTLLILIGLFSDKDKVKSTGSWLAGCMLFVYAAAFSFAYITLSTATGALILFGAVQITIILTTVLRGNTLHRLEWLGTVIAFSGFVYLVLPGLSTPSAMGFVLMVMSGIAWGTYTLLGKHSVNPLQDTAFNFVKSLPLAAIVLAMSFSSLHATLYGVVLAILSGAIASGIGYSIWYSVLRHISSTVAAVVQLFVPVFAALGGVLFVSEALTWRLVLSGALILGGIVVVVSSRHYLANRINNA